MVAGPGYYACPLCRRTVERSGRGDGFRKRGLLSHIWSCWEKGLAAKGFRLGTWSDRKNGYRLLLARRALTPSPKHEG